MPNSAGGICRPYPFNTPYIAHADCQYRKGSRRVGAPLRDQGDLDAFALGRHREWSDTLCLTKRLDISEIYGCSHGSLDEIKR
jgi:hypothetical protein